MVSNVYSKSFVQSSPTFLYASRIVIFQRLLPRIVSLSASSAPSSKSTSAEREAIELIDARKLFESVTMDLVTAYMLGPRNASNFLEKPAEAAEWLKLYQSRKKHVFWPQEMPKTTAFFERLGVSLSPAWVSKANHKLEAWCLEHCDAAEAQLMAAEEGDQDAARAEMVPVVYAQLRSQLAREAAKQSSVPLSAALARIQIASEVLDHASAGHETSAITLTFLFHELSLRPSLQRRLQDELKTLEPGIVYPPLSPDGGLDPNTLPALPTPKQLDALPLLHALLMETLRLHPAIPGPQPRVTPFTPDGVTLGPYTNIPGGMRVSASPMCLHRNDSVFPEPESWIPERWLLESGVNETELQERHRWFWAFGSGGRMCIGSNLAMAQMKLIVAAVLSSFRLIKADQCVGRNMDDGEDSGERHKHCAKEGQQEGGYQEEPLSCAAFEQEDAYTAQPVSPDLLLRFVPW